MAGRPTKYQGTKTIRKVEALISAMTAEKFFDFCSIDHIAYALSVHRDTIYEWQGKHPEFSDVIKTWEARRNVLFYKLIVSPQVKPALWIWLSKQWLGMKDYIDTAHSGELGIKPLQIIVTTDGNKPDSSA